ncbi:regulatory LuxR family protein [Kribbella orskensis]|uniref:Regulatory LuxR family protein n=1 Tax=Kribbella orskensis TaxID=2512216 RepID=A0ABY2BMY4_9ACTN|nr:MULTISPECIES: LuxR family transcriptional regulator [Kribbella]TCN41905.1 regulatory LuxR family protein [Kribbella sp. VKM Ac-2500]TCO25783.1 regulatory LuxR family protein [Kribbella orskensis]
MTDAPCSPHSSSQLVGRESELRMIHETVRAAERTGGTLLVVGDAGIGKSVLLDAAAAVAAGNGDRVLRAAGVEFETDISFAGLNQLLLPVMREAALRDSPQSGPLRVALGLDSGPAPNFLAVSNAVLELLAELAAAVPVLLVVDDVPWLDRSSAVVLGLVARRLTDVRVGLLVGQRTGANGFFEYSGMTQLVLRPLDDAASEELLRQRHPQLGPRARRRILDEAQGNPLALTELPALRDGRKPLSALPMSRRLHEVFAVRISGLPDATRELLLLAALSGPCYLRVIAGSVEAIRHLDPALREGVVELDQQTGKLSFRHPLSRLAVVELSTLAERNEAHRLLADRSPDPVRRARHLAEATVEPDEEVAGLVEQAAHIVLRRGDAVASVETLTRAAELSVDRQARIRRLAEAATIGAEVTGTLGSAEELLATANQYAVDPSSSLQLSMAAASVLFNRDCAVDTPHRLLTLALEAHADKVDSETLAEALQLLAMVCYFGGRAKLWVPFHTEMDRLGAAAPASLVLLSGLWDPVYRAKSVLPLLDDELRSLGGLDNPWEIIRIGVASVYVDRIGECREALWRVVEDGRQGGAVSAAINAIVSLTVDGWMHGRWDEVDVLVAEGRELAKLHGYLRYTWVFDGYISNLVGAARGIETAEAGAAELDQWAGSRGALVVKGMAQQIYCLVALGRGDFDTAYRYAAEISPPGVFPPYMPQALWVLFELVESAMRSGREREARAHVEAARAASIDELSSRLAVVVRGAEALVAPEDRRTELFEQALAVPGAEQWPFDLARVRLCYGEALRRERHIAAARRQLSAARAVFDQLGARPWARRAANELRAAGLTRSQASHPAAIPLTAQEREIAMLAATGLTNKEIGERLALSPRTVAAHLYRTFPKLGITARAALRDALSARPDD